METYLTIAQVFVSLALISTILLQKQGAEVGGIFSGSQESYYRQRGIEKGLYFGTVALAVLFLSLGLANLVV